MGRVALFRIITINHFPAIKYTINRIAFENACESTTIFQSLLFVNITAESTSYAPTFISSVLSIFAADENGWHPFRKFGRTLCPFCIRFVFNGQWTGSLVFYVYISRA